MAAGRRKGLINGVLGMKRKTNTIALIRLSDIIIIIVLAAVSFSFLFLRTSGNEGLVAAVLVGKEEVYSFDLEKIEEPVVLPLESEGIKLSIRVEKGKIRFESSECPDKICVNTGWLVSKGDTAVCLPARAAIVVSGRKKLDAITG